MQSARAFRPVTLIALAIIVLVMQSLALVHRIAHSDHGASFSESVTEPWLIVANGGEVSIDEWNRAVQNDVAASTFDPWHSHESAADCERFDAVAAFSALIDCAAPPKLPHANEAVFARDYLANLVARMPRAYARAPPLAPSLA